ncbi:SPASM domain-containing protein [Candidatus Culexarchaeum yellowstonense]|uniref:SPASM domain-containing protein n=1 Tax=Candidatus Culexarchaeum yellowstonense TaxID=2928963 RepID=UPI0034E96354
MKSCTIEPNGNVLPCPAFEDLPMFIARNIREQSLAEIWNKSRVFLGIRKFWMETKNFCGCKYFEICKGRCLAQRYYSYGRMDGGQIQYVQKVYSKFK